MKRIILTTVLLTISYFLYSQTTLEEYNYLTKGYKIQVESGLDMKKGYRMINEPSLTMGNYKFKTHYLLKDSIDKPSATLIIIEPIEKMTNEIQKPVYLCLPSLNTSPEVYKKYFDSISQFSWGLSQSYLFYLSVLYSGNSSCFEVKQ